MFAAGDVKSTTTTTTTTTKSTTTTPTTTQNPCRNKTVTVYLQQGQNAANVDIIDALSSELAPGEHRFYPTGEVGTCVIHLTVKRNGECMVLSVQD